jgi:hypothetical protein
VCCFWFHGKGGNVGGLLQRRRMKSRMGKPGGGGWRQRWVASGGGMEV